MFKLRSEKLTRKSGREFQAKAFAKTLRPQGTERGPLEHRARGLEWCEMRLERQRPFWPFGSLRPVRLHDELQSEGRYDLCCERVPSGCSGSAILHPSKRIRSMDESGQEMDFG